MFCKKKHLVLRTCSTSRDSVDALYLICVLCLDALYLICVDAIGSYEPELGEICLFYILEYIFTYLYIFSLYVRSAATSTPCENWNQGYQNPGLQETQWPWASAISSEVGVH